MPPPHYKWRGHKNIKKVGINLYFINDYFLISDLWKDQTMILCVDIILLCSQLEFDAEI